MAEDGFMWIYLIFFMIPLARIIPRLVRKWQNKESVIPQNQYNPNFQRGEQKAKTVERAGTFEKVETVENPLSKKMQVLGEINRGIKDFNQIQKNLKIENKELENILKDFEDDGLMRVIKKDGVTGSKIELYPTEKGFKEFNK